MSKPTPTFLLPTRGGRFITWAEFEERLAPSRGEKLAPWAWLAGLFRTWR